MKTFRPSLLALSITAAISSSAYASIAVNINPDAAGPAPVIAVGGLDWNVGNSLSTPLKVTSGSVTNLAQGDVIQTYLQASLANFNNTLGAAIGGTGLNSNYEWTIVAGFAEAVLLPPTPFSAFLANVDAATTAFLGGQDFFQIYASPIDANNLTGSGFNNGTLVMSGTIDGYNGSVGASNIGVTSLNCNTGNTSGCGLASQVLDQYGSSPTNNYVGVQSISVSGGGTANLTVDYANAAYFPSGAPLDLTMNYTTSIIDPYNQTDPSDCFTNKTGGVVTGLGNAITSGGPTACSSNPNTVGAINGVSGPNEVEQVDANASFNGTIPAPEPATLALLGIGLTGLGFSHRRSKG